MIDENIVAYARGALSVYLGVSVTQLAKWCGVSRMSLIRFLKYKNVSKQTYKKVLEFVESKDIPPRKY